jgi:hypothetical protein
MSVFAVIPVTPPSQVEQKIKEIYAANHVLVAPNVWFVADTGVTTQEVCEKLGVKKDGIPGVVVTKVDSFWGLANSQLWEWLAVKMKDS